MISQRGAFIADYQRFMCQSCKQQRPVIELLEIRTGFYCPGDCLIQGLEESVMELQMREPRFCLECHLIMDETIPETKQKKPITCFDCSLPRVEYHLRCQQHQDLFVESKQRNNAGYKEYRGTGGGKYAY